MNHQEKVELLGIKDKVVFVPPPADPTPYYKTADVLIETGQQPLHDETVLRAIASGLPIICYATPLRLDLLEDKTSALICEQADAHCLTQKISQFLNSQALRVKFKRREKLIVKDRLHEDTDSYYQVYRDSIETALLGESSVTTS